MSCDNVTVNDDVIINVDDIIINVDDFIIDVDDAIIDVTTTVIVAVMFHFLNFLSPLFYLFSTVRR